MTSTLGLTSTTTPVVLWVSAAGAAAYDSGCVSSSRTSYDSGCVSSSRTSYDSGCVS